MSVIEKLRGGVIVSCQAYEGEPLHRPGIMPLFAQTAEAHGAVAVRLEGRENVREAASVLRIPVIGIVKAGASGVRITPTLADGLALAEAGARIIAVDGTRRPRPDGRSLRAVVEELHRQTGAVVMADCGSVDDGRAAEDAGADLIGTTLAGYTGERPPREGPDLELVSELSVAVERPIIAEGRYETPGHVRSALALGAFAVCVGSAVTHPGRLTRRFVDAAG